MITYCSTALPESNRDLKMRLPGADRAIVVTTPEVSAVRDADRIIGLLEANEIGKTELVVNRLRADMVKCVEI